MWPSRWSNAARKHQEKWRFYIEPIGLFSQKHSILTQNIFFIFNAARQALLSVSNGPQDTLSLRVETPAVIPLQILPFFFRSWEVMVCDTSPYYL
jgi:hypothetical protein